MDTTPKNIDCQSGILIFEINKREFCVDLENILAILTYSEYANLSGAGLKVEKGFTLDNHNVDIVKIEDINAFDNLNEFRDTFRLIIIDAKNRYFGLWVDIIKEIRILGTVECEKFKEKLKNGLEDRNDTIIKSVVKFNNRVLVIPNYDETCNMTDKGKKI